MLTLAALLAWVPCAGIFTLLGGLCLGFREGIVGTTKGRALGASGGVEAWPSNAIAIVVARDAKLRVWG